MGEALHEALRAHSGVVCRVYAPVGPHRDLLAYLVRRLIENGANASFVARAAEPEAGETELLADPLESLRRIGPLPSRPPASAARSFRARSARIPPGSNSAAIAALAGLLAEIAPHRGAAGAALRRADFRRCGFRQGGKGFCGVARDAGRAARGYSPARRRSVRSRARPADRPVAGGGEKNPRRLRSPKSARRPISAAITPPRRDRFCADETLPGVTGEENILRRLGRGVFVCISPWNFPLAIFSGQIAAALAAGNCVVAKPAEQTPRVAPCGDGKFSRRRACPTALWSARPAMARSAPSSRRRSRARRAWPSPARSRRRKKSSAP